MLERTSHAGSSGFAPSSADSVSDRLNVDHLIGAIRRQWPVLVISMIAFLIMGIGYLFYARPLYTASATVLIDVNNIQVVDKLTASNVANLGDGAVTSQIEIMGAEKIRNRVVDKLDLADDADFIADDPTIGQHIVRLIMTPFIALFGSVDDVGDDSGEQNAKEKAIEEAVDRRATAIGYLEDKFSAERVNETYTIVLSYEDKDPERASKIVQAFAEAYLVDQLESKYDAQRRASEWMEGRIDELRQKSLSSDMAVQKFRADHNLLASDGKLITDQQLADVTAQLGIAQADRSRTKAKYDQITAMIKAGNVDATVSDALTSDVINQLRSRYLEAVRMRNEIAPRLGEKHEQVIRLEGQMNEFKNLIFNELARIGESYRNDYEIALAKEKEMTARLAAVSGTSSEANTTQVQLRELERESDSYRTLYQTFLQQLQESRQQQTFPITEARIITSASVPSTPSSPKRNITLALSVMLGGLFGGCFAAFREFRDTFFRTGEQVREALSVPFMGYLPLIADRKLKRETLRQPGIISKTSAIQDYSVMHPFSAGAETLRNIKVTIDHAVGGVTAVKSRPLIVGIVSVLPQEGKSTIAINLAEMLTIDGSPTLLIDADLRNPSLSKSMASHTVVGLQECVLDGLPLRDAVIRNPVTGLIMLPTGGCAKSPDGNRTRVRNTSEFLGSPGMAQVLAQAKGCKYVILDLPPIAALVDARVAADFVDAFVMVIEWGHTARRVVQTVLSNEPLITQKCVGSVLNRADMKKILRYQTYGSAEFYQKRIAAYYERETA